MLILKLMLLFGKKTTVYDQGVIARMTTPIWDIFLKITKFMN